jgi:hypothetical protein
MHLPIITGGLGGELSSGTGCDSREIQKLLRRWEPVQVADIIPDNDQPAAPDAGEFLLVFYPPG